MELNGEIQDFRMDKSVWSVESLNNLAYEQLLPKPRSLAWAILLKILPPLDEPIDKFLATLKTHRDCYQQLSTELTKDPRYVVDDDPLSQNDGSAWKQHFYDNELKALILQDVVRTFPDESYFRDNNVQDLMVRVLFVWSRHNSELGYRQGMHEILAILLYELYLDRVYLPAVVCDVLRFYLDNKYLEHDSYMIFNGVMSSLQRFYSTGDVIPAPNGRLPTTETSLYSSNEVVRYLENVREQYLVPLDPELARHLHDNNVKLEFFGIRWLRLLFGREFPLRSVGALWGYMFAEGPAMPHLHYVVLAMLIAVRRTLLSLVGCGVLSALMRESLSCVTYVVRLSRHLASPHTQPRPQEPTLHDLHSKLDNDSSTTESWSISSERELAEAVMGSQPIAPIPPLPIHNDADIARALGTLAVVRARLPAAAAALAAALPEPHPHPLRDILQLARLLECRNHSFIDVETALEAAEGQPESQTVGRPQLVPVAVVNQHQPRTKPNWTRNRVKEVPLRLFRQVECAPHNDLPSLDPLRLRTE